MRRSEYFNYIEEHLNILSYRIKIKGKINILDLNILSEAFFANLMSYLLGYELINLNPIKQNMPAIDLVDDSNKVIVQVSSTCSKQKIESALAKSILSEYANYKFIFVAISGEAKNLRRNTFENPHNIKFDPTASIYDIQSILDIVLNMEINKQKNLFDFIKNELGVVPDIVKFDTNIAAIINILSQEDLANVTESPEINAYEIDRKIEFNDLENAIDIIDDYKIYYSKIVEKYNEFDKLGANKSMSVLSIIRKQYIQMSHTEIDSYNLFITIIDKLIEIIKSSKNYIDIPYEELEMCVSILVVDAFIRCKIFKNPEGYNHVVTR